MRRAIPFFLLLLLPLGAWADGMVIPTVAYPAKITIPDQQVAISFSNGIERLVIETRFTGSGTNFAWVVPLPSQPVIEEATAGLFPTLQYLFRPEVVHHVPKYFIGILLGIAFVYLLWRVSRSVADAFEIALTYLLLIFLAALLLPGLSAAKRKGMDISDSSQNVSILDRKLVGIFETVTITSHDGRALENWLRDNDYAIAPDAKPVIDGYLKDGWVFVAAKVHRNDASIATNSPHPLSFTFKTAKPVYPMRLTGLVSQSLNVDLYYFGQTSATAPHFKMESSTREVLFHPLLRQWFGETPAITKLTATLSAADMRNDVWLNILPGYSRLDNRLYSWQGALITSLNWGVGIFAISLAFLCGQALFCTARRPILARRMSSAAVVCVALAACTYTLLPKIEVKLVKGGYWRSYNNMKEEAYTLGTELDDSKFTTVAEARSLFQQITASDPTNTYYPVKNWDNYVVGGRFREEDSPGNYLLRETNNQLEMILIDSRGAEDPTYTMTWPLQHQNVFSK